jgi:hypothetical protein
LLSSISIGHGQDRIDHSSFSQPLFKSETPTTICHPGEEFAQFLRRSELAISLSLSSVLEERKAIMSSSGPEFALCNTTFQLSDDSNAANVQDPNLLYVKDA